MSKGLRQKAAADYLGYKDPRVLFKLPIRRSNVAPEGSAKAEWRWQQHDLDAFLESRVVKAGYEGLDLEGN